MSREEFFKSLGIPKLSELLAQRSRNVIAERQEKQRNIIWSRREGLAEIIENEPKPSEKRKTLRAEMLKKWKAEKEKKLEEAKKSQKPIFKVGIVHRKATGSPILTNNPTFVKKKVGVGKENINNTIVKDSKKGMITRSKAKHLESGKSQVNTLCQKKEIIKNESKFCRFENGKQKQLPKTFRVPEVVKKLPYSNKLLCGDQKEKKQTILKEQEETIVLKPKQMDTNHGEEVGINQTKIINKKDENLMEDPANRIKSLKQDTPKSNNYLSNNLSPVVTVGSGIKCHKKSDKPLDLNEEIKKEENEFHCRILLFRNYIECETKRLLDKSEKWKCIYKQFEELPSSVEGDIDCILGKTKLLTSDKFMQFKDLIDKCEIGDPMIKLDDLQGFQDWVSIEVERIDKEFCKLEKLKSCNWVADTVEVHNKPQTKAKVEKEKINKNKSKKSIVKSNIRSHILAARKLMEEGITNGNSNWNVAILESQPKIKKTPIKELNLFKEVLTSGTKLPSTAKERRNSGLEIMFATHKNKLPLKSSPAPVNMCEIYVSEKRPPIQSILKKSPRVESTHKGHVKFVNIQKSKRGLDEKYLMPSLDDESPMRTPLVDVGNITPSRVTRSRSRLLSNIL